MFALCTASELTEIVPFSTLSGIVRTWPWSAPSALPVSSVITQLCNGQVTEWPCTMPWLSGPLLCGQWSSSANTSLFGRAEQRDASALGTNNARTAHGNVLELQTADPGLRDRHHCAASYSLTIGQRHELMLVLAGDPLGPGVQLSEFLGEHEAIVERATAVGLVHDLLADLSEADALGPFVDALKIARLLAVHLGQGHDCLECLVLGLDMPQHLRALDVEAGGAGEMDLVAGSRRR